MSQALELNSALRASRFEQARTPAPSPKEADSFQARSGTELADA